MTLKYHTRTGHAVRPILGRVADLRISVFRDWPYLYDGDATYERRYLEPYADSERAIIVTAEADDTIVGAATGMPLVDHEDDFSSALAGHDITTEEVFYCAESVLLPDWRGRGAGHAFFDAREAHAKALGLRWSMFCAVVRPMDHPQRPAEYRPLDGFWHARGYQKLPGAIAQFAWRDIGEADESHKPLQVWLRDLGKNA